MSYLNRAIVLFLSAVFLFTGIDKAFHYNGFVNALQDYVVIPPGTAHLLATPVIAIELLIGIGLLLRPWRRQAALTGAVTLAVFTIAIGMNYAYGNRGVCGCWFTVTLAQGTGMHVAQNLAMLGLALATWWDQRMLDLPRLRERPAA